MPSAASSSRYSTAARSMAARAFASLAAACSGAIASPEVFTIPGPRLVRARRAGQAGGRQEPQQPDSDQGRGQDCRLSGSGGRDSTRLAGDVFLLSAVSWASFTLAGPRVTAGVEPLRATLYATCAGSRSGFGLTHDVHRPDHQHIVCAPPPRRIVRHASGSRCTRPALRSRARRRSWARTADRTADRLTTSDVLCSR